MNEAERENQQYQAEILDKIDSLHAAVVRRRMGRIGGLAVVTVVAAIWLNPIDNRTLPQSVQVAQHKANDAILADTANLSFQTIVVEEQKYSPSKMQSVPATAENVQDDQAIPDAAVVNPIHDEGKTMLPVSIPEVEAEPPAKVEEAPKAEHEPKVRIFESHKQRKTLKTFFAAANDPNTDGTNLSIKIDLKSNRS